MAESITIDGAGRVVIPAPMRRELALAAGSQLEVAVEQGAIVLRPVTAAHLARRSGRLVVRGALTGKVPDHREIREERLERDIGRDR